MFDQALPYCKDAQHSLIICGLQHLAGLQTLFATEFETAEIIDLRKEKWFRTDWRLEAMGREQFNGF
jgi:hypothetical protein